MTDQSAPAAVATSPTSPTVKRSERSQCSSRRGGSRRDRFDRRRGLTRAPDAAVPGPRPFGARDPCTSATVAGGRSVGGDS
ncbi:MAG: hypothetical protein J0H99_21675, partial [Rhodospirillales bacterium]|nr:hypothetical protein [Rhodospirillales bacterium]